MTAGPSTYFYPQLPSTAFARTFRRRLLDWFGHAQRDLPWRRDRDPYRIWVSEIMLQQTQVAAVVPYFERFLRAFPTIRALAAAPEAEVLRAWEGLGYYRRARNLHRAAQQLVDEHDGQFPRDPEVVRALPGIGRYTLGAILSQAFEQRLPILEANTLRMLSRVLACTEDPRRGAANRWLWEAAGSLLPARQVGEFNQALMELGALVCTPRQPLCLLCPVAEQCAARSCGWQEKLPVRGAAVETTTVTEAGVVIWRGPRVLLVRRPPDAERWAGFWEFPHAPLDGELTAADAARRLVRELTGLRVRLGREFMTLQHGVTRFAISVVCFHASYVGGRFQSSFYQQGAWKSPSAMGELPMSVPQRKLALAVEEWSKDRPGRRSRA